MQQSWCNHFKFEKSILNFYIKKVAEIFFQLLFWVILRTWNGFPGKLTLTFYSPIKNFVLLIISTIIPSPWHVMMTHIFCLFSWFVFYAVKSFIMYIVLRSHYAFLIQRFTFKYVITTFCFQEPLFCQPKFVFECLKYEPYILFDS